MDKTNEPASLYGGYTLRKGDNDKRKTWGGKRQTDSGEYVAELQTFLSSCGVYLDKVDGDFGKLTHEAVERLQWNAKNNDYRLKNTILTYVAPSYKGKIDGIVGKNTKTEMLDWINANYITTGSLVRVNINDYGNISLNSAFKKLIHPSINDNEILVDKDMAPYLKIINTETAKIGVTISLSQTLRIKGAIISGASYQPADKSQHYIGHAIDCNIVDGDNFNRQIDFKNNKQTENAKKFIKNVKTQKLRWGGDFPADKNGNKDTPHFDKQVPSTSKEYSFKYFFNQQSFTKKQPIRKL